MAQNYTPNCFNEDGIGFTDLQNMENNFAALRSSFSGSSSPSNPIAGHPWFDTSRKLLKVRSADNDEWFGIMQGDTSQKIWVYRDTAQDGWQIDTSIYDIALVLKDHGAGAGTYTTAGATAGTWSISGLSTSTDGSHDHDIDNTQTGASGSAEYVLNSTGDLDTDNAGSHSHTATGDGSWRISAAVGTLQYPYVS